MINYIGIHICIIYIICVRDKIVNSRIYDEDNMKNKS